MIDRGREEFLTNRLLQLSGEALLLRVGQLAKQLSDWEPALTTDPAWSQAAKKRDFIAHHYHAVDAEQLWVTLTESMGSFQAQWETIADQGFLPD